MKWVLLKQKPSHHTKNINFKYWSSITKEEVIDFDDCSLIFGHLLQMSIGPQRKKDKMSSGCFRFQSFYISSATSSGHLALWHGSAQVEEQSSTCKGQLNHRRSSNTASKQWTHHKSVPKIIFQNYFSKLFLKTDYQTCS